MAEEQPKERKKAVNGKAKGSGFENTIAKLLSDTFKPMQFRRSQSSGAILGGKNAWLMNRFSDDAKTLFIGDVVPTNEADVQRAENWRFRFTLECKFYKEQDSFTSLFKNPQVRSWFEQAHADALKIPDKLALLIFKFNHTPIFAACETSVPLPSTVSSVVSLCYNVINADDNVTEKRHINITLLNELLEDHSWWKVTTENSVEQ
jgi:hypothetical protein